MTLTLCPARRHKLTKWRGRFKWQDKGCIGIGPQYTTTLQQHSSKAVARSRTMHPATLQKLFKVSTSPLNSPDPDPIEDLEDQLDPRRTHLINLHYRKVPPPTP